MTVSFVADLAELRALDLLELVAHLVQLVLGKSLFPGRENDRVLARGVVLVHEDEALHGAGERLGIAAADRTLAGNGEDIFGHLPAAVMLRLEHVGVSLVLVAAQIADALSTRAVFAALPGASEANPLIAAAQAHLGSAWWLPKVGVALMLMLLLRYRPQRRMVLVISLVSTVPSLVNLANLWWG